MARQAAGEYQASQRLAQAADRLVGPTALQLRLFQTLNERADEQNSTLIFPLPIDRFLTYKEAGGEKSDGESIP